MSPLALIALLTLGNVPGRKSVSLDGPWHVIVDPYENGLAGRYFEDRKPAFKNELIEYDFDRSPALSVPGDWNLQRESLYFYEGPLWYERHFKHRKQGRAFLNFEAANSKARVWLNGKELGEHIGGFTPFQFEITEAAVDGDNRLVVEVDNTRRAEDVPALMTDWWNFGGLTRGVQIVEVPEAYIRDYSVQWSKGAISGWVQLSAQGAVRVAIPELGISQEAASDASGRAELSLKGQPELWSPANPRLYRVVVSAGADQVSELIGFRTIETRGAQILLNGKPIFLKGISLHEEAPFREGRAYSEQDDRQLLDWARELGCNFVRLAHYPHNEAMVRLADRLGFLVWEEIPVYWDTAWENPATLANARAQLRDTIARDRNRASIILWSLSNETPLVPQRLAFLKTLAADARALDGTRLITSATNRIDRSGNTNVLNDPLGSELDVLGLNEYLGWYDRTPAEIDQAGWRTAFEKPLIVSEFGADAPYGLHGDKQARWTEEYQAELYARQIAMLKKIPSLAGMSPWLLMDFHSPRRQLPGVQDFHNRKGLVSPKGEHKQAFFVLQKYYRER